MTDRFNKHEDFVDKSINYAYENEFSISMCGEVKSLTFKSPKKLIFLLF